MLEMVEETPNWKVKLITGDETWVYGYDPETKRQSIQSMEWKGKDEPRTKKSRLCKLKNKVLLVTFFDIKGIVHYEYLEEGQTINKESHLNIMRRVRESIRLKRSEMRLGDLHYVGGMCDIRHFRCLGAVLELSWQPDPPQRSHRVHSCTLASIVLCLLDHFMWMPAYTDDFLIMPKNQKSLQVIMYIVGDLTEKMGFHFKDPNCAILHLDCRKKRRALLTTFCIQVKPISPMKKDDAYCYHGILTDYNKTRNLNEVIRSIKENNTFSERLTYSSRSSGKNSLDSPNEPEAKSVSTLIPKGGAEMMPFGDRTDLDGLDITSIWSDARSASRCLKKRSGLLSDHNPTIGDPTIRLPNPGKKTDTSTFSSLDRGQVMEGLMIQGLYLRNLVINPDQGKI
ncbi:CLCN3 [Cordylochernes scorpioides]|uniref:CLCN3 n=1 Tax=Cordylochernes scorpioides TaxID=51811 RepID=A0ABY6JYV4_9ARAC|nr:CLCN3 [Cordylochernes scorpioides]